MEDALHHRVLCDACTACSRRWSSLVTSSSIVPPSVSQNAKGIRFKNIIKLLSSLSPALRLGARKTTEKSKGIHPISTLGLTTLSRSRFQLLTSPLPLSRFRSPTPPTQTLRRFPLPPSSCRWKSRGYAPALPSARTSLSSLSSSSRTHRAQSSSVLVLPSAE